MNEDVKYMLYVMNHDNCPDKNKHYCRVCDKRIFCSEYIPGNIPGNKPNNIPDKTV